MLGVYVISAAFIPVPGPVDATPIDFTHVDGAGVIFSAGLGYRWMHTVGGEQTCDLNDDGFINGNDYDLFLMAYQYGSPAADFDGNGFVNGDDYDLFDALFRIGGK